MSTTSLSPNNLIECDKYPGRLGTICRGEADLPLEKINAYRERWGFEPLVEVASETVRTKNTFHAPADGKRSSCCGQVAAPTLKRKSLVQRALQYAEAWKRHREDDSAAPAVDDLMFRQQQCAGCPLNKDDKCTLCECPLKKNTLNNGKLFWRSECCPVGKWSRQNNTRRPLVSPVHHLIFHIYPKKGAEWNWHWHIQQIRKYAPQFNGKICIGISTDSNTATADEVKAVMAGIPVSEWVIVNNTKKRAETATHVELLKCIQTEDPNHVVFRYHTKGVTHQKTSIEQRWAGLMWQVNMDLSGVHDALSSHLTCGVMRSQKPLVVKPNSGNFFYAGSAYWMRCKEVFERDWATVENDRWWVEYVPAHLFKFHESSCLLHDFTESSVLSKQYFDSVVQPEWDNWKFARGL